MKNLDPARNKSHAIKEYAANVSQMIVYVGQKKVGYQIMKQYPQQKEYADNTEMTKRISYYFSQ